MKDIISGWRVHGLMKSRVFKIIFPIILFFFILLSLTYYFYNKKLEREDIIKKQEILVAEERKKISNFYLEQFDGYQYDDVVLVMNEIMISSYPLVQGGFQLEKFACALHDCHFSYRLKQGAIFNMQEMNFFNNAYEGIISSDTLDFYDIKIRYTNESNKNKTLNAPNCNDYINYIYGYNSSKHDEHNKIIIIELPSSSVSSLEQKHTGFINSHNLLFAKIEMLTSNNPIELSLIFKAQPYLDSYTFKSVEQIDSHMIKLTGVFACKKH